MFVTIIFTRVRKHLVAVLALLIAITGVNLSIVEAAETPQPLATLRKPATPCGLYLSQMNNGTGIKVADLEETSIEAFFASRPDLEATISVVDSENLKPFDDFEALQKAVVAGRTKAEKKERYLFLVGLPWPKSQSQRIVDLVNAKVAGENFDFPPRVIALRKPSSTGIARVKEEMIYLLVPFASDAAPATPDEIKLGMQSVAISSGITIATQTVMQGIAVGLPASLMNMLFSICTTIFRPFWGNYFSRHDQSPDKWLKQAWLTSFFTIGVYWASKIFTPELSDIATLHGWLLLMSAKWPSVLFQTLWRTPMENGLNDFIQTESAKGNATESRRLAASIRRWGTIFSTNCWLISVLYGKPLFHAGMDWNIGHIGMILSAVVFRMMEKNPEWYHVGESEFRTKKYSEIRIKIGQSLRNIREKLGLKPKK